MMESYAYHLLKALVMLGVVLGVMALFFYALRLLQRGGRTGAGRTSPVRVVTTAFLGQRRNIAIVDVAGELLVLGLTPTSITLLTRLERAESLERVRRFEEGGEGSFVEVLQERLGLRGGRDGEAGR